MLMLSNFLLGVVFLLTSMLVYSFFPLQSECRVWSSWGASSTHRTTCRVRYLLWMLQDHSGLEICKCQYVQSHIHLSYVHTYIQYHKVPLDTKIQSYNITTTKKRTGKERKEDKREKRQSSKQLIWEKLQVTFQISFKTWWWCLICRYVSSDICYCFVWQWTHTTWFV